MDPMGGHCNNRPLANTGFLPYPSYPPPPPPSHPPPPPPFDYMSLCHSTPDFWTGYDWTTPPNPDPDPRGPCHQHLVRGHQVVPCQERRPAIPAPTPSDVGSVVLAAGPHEVSAPKTSSAALREQHAHESQLDPSLECLSEHERMLVARRKQRVSWDRIHEEYVNLYGPTTVDALRMRLSRLKNKHSSVRQAFPSKEYSKEPGKSR
ncbi:hypothetical protein EDB81DRAFT_807363 [Dactylonectria macrodidyma]|uniref:Uncharacterized protein n=1 Tax=Dactylonectria macrodidyma TaxID=307937 RepID=A0A9P9E7T5_9HYPO|nr:hypothetical protein EDB81DRAFT_807363 [Dactylonectria macrodidyma]